MSPMITIAAWMPIRNGSARASHGLEMFQLIDIGSISAAPEGLPAGGLRVGVEPE